jgi:hypothetical protein
MPDTATQETTTDAQPDETTGAPVEDQADSSGDRPMPREQRYRLERNTAREALSTTQGKLAALQTREVLRLAGEHLADPADLLGLGGDVSLVDLLDDDGVVDPEAIAEVAAGIVATRPGLAKNPPPPRAVDTTQGMGGPAGKAKPEWVDLFRV